MGTEGRAEGDARTESPSSETQRAWIGVATAGRDRRVDRWRRLRGRRALDRLRLDAL